MDPAELTEALGMIPKTAHRAGSQRKTPKGELLKGTYETSYWSHRFDVTGASELGHILTHLAFRLRVYEPIFRRVVSEKGSVDLFCGIYADGNWDEIISSQLMRSLADIHIDLRLDVYPDRTSAD